MENAVALPRGQLDVQLKVAANILGYRQMPVSIEQFFTDPFYLGDVCKYLYPFWKDKLKQIYPTPIHTEYPILVFKGGIGTGKSTAVRVMACYMIHRLMCLRNIHNTFKLMPGKNIKFSFFTYTNGLGETDFLQPINDWMGSSPYFKQCWSEGKLDEIERVADGPRGNKNIGSDVIN